MRRVALLGATGSIGRQAIEIVTAHPDLELCGLMSGATPLDDLAAAHGVAHVQVGGDAVTLLERCEPGGRLGVAGLLASERAEFLASLHGAPHSIVEERTDEDASGGEAWWSAWLARGGGP